MTVTVGAVGTAVDIPTIRYSTPTGEKIGHLLPRTWPATKRRGRPSACGKWRVLWRPVDRFDDPSAYRPCPLCTAAAGLPVEIVRAPVRIAPTAPPRRVDPHGVTPHRGDVVDNTQAGRTLRRANFREHGLRCP